MSINHAIKKLIGEPELQERKVGSLDYFKQQASIIQRKPLLRQGYLNFYNPFIHDLKAIADEVSGDVLELGSGGGFLRELIPDLITSDVYPEVADLVIDARELPQPSGSVKAIFLNSVLHHVPEPRKFFGEVDRVLCPGGICALVEPSATFFSRIFYRFFHHEPYDLNTQSWEFEQNNAMLDTNQALSWIIFDRDRSKFQKEFKNLSIEKTQHLPTLGYVLSGGVNYKPLLPDSVASIIKKLEKSLHFLDSQTSLAWYVLLKKSREF